MNVPFIDLKAQYKSIKKEVYTSVNQVLQDGKFILGERVNDFEKKFAKYLGAKYCVTVNSGTDALILGTKALNIPSGNEILIPTYTFVATALAATNNGLRPVFVDINEKDFGINIDDLKRKINSRTSAIILVHLYGQPDKIAEVKEIIKKTGKKIFLIEDAAQAHGAMYKNKKVGTFSVFSIFSFYPTKNLGAYGDGGAIVTNDRALATRYRLLREYGQKKKYYYEFLSINSRFDALQAAILLVKLKYLDSWNKKRQYLAALYSGLLNPLSAEVKTPNIFFERKSVFHLYTIRAKRRNQLKQFLSQKGIETLIHYPIPLHLQKAFRFLQYKKGDLPIAEKITKQVLSLPIYPELTKQQIKYTVKNIKKFYE